MRIKTIDMHTGGEPLRVIVEGFPKLEGKSVLNKRNYAKQNLDSLRTALMWEPRGHADMYGCIVTDPNPGDGDFGILFLHNEGYSTMCGHAIIAISKLAVEKGWIRRTGELTKIKIDAPCGRILSSVHYSEEKFSHVSFIGVPSFVVNKKRTIKIEDWDEVEYDIAYGGAFYAYIDISRKDVEISTNNYSKLKDLGQKFKKAIQEEIEIDHPFEKDLSFLYGVIFMQPTDSKGVDSRNVCIFADGEVDRSPTGSGVMGRMALHFQQGILKVGDSMIIESITGSTFKGKVYDTVEYGGIPSVIPEVSGTAFITGEHTFIIDPEDPFKHGFILH
jgi:trans-L-3-hydroxyproline dehydratase